jgi:hypothetical protein
VPSVTAAPAPTATTSASSPTTTLGTATPTTVAAAGAVTLRDALTSAGASVDRAPTAIGSLLDLETCGLVTTTNLTRLTQPRLGLTERRCFLDAHVTQRLAITVERTETIEGQPIVYVYVVLTDGAVAQFADTTRDGYSSREFVLGVCRVLTTQSRASRSDPSRYTGDECALSETLTVATTIQPPNFISDRSALPLCGYQLTPDLLNTGGWQCFHDAIVRGQPAEYVYVNRNAFGRPIANWLRTAGPGSYEILMHHQERADDPTRTWTRITCAGALPHPADPSPLHPPMGHDCRVTEQVKT